MIRWSCCLRKLSATAGGKGILLVEARGKNLVQKTQSEITIAAPKLKVEVARKGIQVRARQGYRK